MIGILNIGMGNLASVANAVYEQGFDYLYVDSLAQLDEISHLIIPGVGHFGKAMENLKHVGLHEKLLPSLQERELPTLGICLGMQLMCRHSAEGKCEGLQIFDTKVRHIDSSRVRVPHVGWNNVHLKRPHPVFEEIKPDRDFYFVHSYAVPACSESWSLAETTYDQPFSSVLAHEHFVGVQFHPEKSQLNGLRIIENFCLWDGSC